MILVTGANGQTGRAIIRTLLKKGQKVRAFVHKQEQINEMKALGAIEVFVGDMMNQSSVNSAYNGVSAVYHICSALNPYEVEIGKIAIGAAKTANISHFIYHSVLHSVLQEMPHHQKKLIVEELVVSSGIPYTIIQPSVFMQNILETWDILFREGIFQQKFFTNNETKMCFLDLDDLAEAVSVIVLNQDYFGATFELCGPENLSLSDMVKILQKELNRKIEVKTPSDELMAEQLKKYGASEYRVSTLLKMFHHYNSHGFIGNSKVLSCIIDKKPNDLSTFLFRTIHDK